MRYKIVEIITSIGVYGSVLLGKDEHYMLPVAKCVDRILSSPLSTIEPLAKQETIISLCCAAFERWRNLISLILWPLISRRWEKILYWIVSSAVVTVDKLIIWDIVINWLCLTPVSSLCDNWFQWLFDCVKMIKMLMLWFASSSYACPRLSDL